MYARKIKDGIHEVGIQDWGRRLFDSLIPLPDGTSYNSYLLRGSEKTALIDTVDPDFAKEYLENLDELDKLDYLITLHSEQDHSGSIPQVLEKFPSAVVICSEKAKDLLVEHLRLDPAQIRTVAEGETISLGDKTLQFYYTPWVHWPETMVAHAIEDRILFSCDFLGSHSAGSELFDNGDPAVMEAAKRYFAEIMMPFRPAIRGNLAKITKLDFDIVAPSHGPLWNHPEDIISAYEDWVSPRVENKVVIPYVSMHGSTAKMVDHLAKELIKNGVKVEIFDLAVTDIGKLAMALVDAATIVIGSPTVHVGPHPIVANAAILANAIKPKARFAAVIGSYGWANQVVDRILALLPNLKVEVLGSVICKGVAKEHDLQELAKLASLIADRHKQL